MAAFKELNDGALDLHAAMKRRLDAQKPPEGPKPLEAEAIPTANPAAPKPEFQAAKNPTFDLQRNRLSQQAQTQKDQGNQAIQRRYAAMGAINSGAAIKQMQLADDAVEQRRAAGEEGIAAQEAADTARQREVFEGRQFEAGEAEKNRLFGAQESARGRNFQREQFNSDMDFRNKVFAFDKESKLRQMDMQMMDLDLRRDESEFNKKKARFEAGQSGGFLGGGGFMGSGFGTKPSTDF